MVTTAGFRLVLGNCSKHALGSLVTVAVAIIGATSAHSSDRLSLPDPLVTRDGRQVLTVESWESLRRPEVLELFRVNVYGRTSVVRPASLAFDVEQTSANAMDGQATRRQVAITFCGPGGMAAINLVLFVPNAVARRAPCLLLICNRDPSNIDPTRSVKSAFWPAEEMVARGYAAAAFHNADVDPDEDDGFLNGVHGIFDDAEGRRPDSWGTIAAWAWGASRVMDYLETDPAIDPARVAIVGHSRGGKTALWAGAQDERFAMVVSNDSGSTGAAIARGKQGERIKNINTSFPHWFCQNYKQFNDREDALPIDQHMLAALVAPRLLYIASATEDRGADPRNEYLAAAHASPVFELYGLPGLVANKMPMPDSPCHEGNIGYHLRAGRHDLTAYDWSRFMDFADRHLVRGDR